MDWVTFLFGIIIGFIIGRFYPVYLKFKKFLEKENEKQNK